MLTRYRRLLRTPGGLSFSAAAFVMRMPLSMVTLAIVLLISIKDHSYGLAGAVSATYAVGTVVSWPVLGRLMDHHGQIRVAIPASALHTLGAAVMIIAVEAGWPHWLLFPLAIFMAAGFLQGQSLTRARWSSLLTDTDLLTAAYSWEQILDEIIFIIGPVLAVILATSLNPTAGLLGELSLLIIGLVLLAPQKATDPGPQPTVHRSGLPAWRSPGILVLSIVLCGMGGIFSSIEVVTVAFARAHGQRGAAAWLLALFGLSSMAAIIFYSVRHWRMELRWRLIIFLAVLSVGMFLALSADNIHELAITLAIGGCGVAPSLVAVFALAEKLAPTGSVTEAISVASAGAPLGGALAASLAGRVIDEFGADASLWVLAISALTAISAAVIGSPWLAAPAEAPQDTEPTQPTESHIGV